MFDVEIRRENRLEEELDRIQYFGIRKLGERSPQVWDKLLSFLLRSLFCELGQDIVVACSPELGITGGSKKWVEYLLLCEMDEFLVTGTKEKKTFGLRRSFRKRNAEEDEICFCLPWRNFKERERRLRAA
ncbi:hypothetical protein KSP40_PGU011756 [Platanthera guangdongensis]|uniref:Uncharacterized protein n=1 Tax=Platanthera guangdongensis TaxID=2320717 RepID=A0ABR2N139_9ASPA